MAECSLTLYPFKSNPFTVKLSERSGQLRRSGSIGNDRFSDLLDSFTLQHDANGRIAVVYSHISYSFFLDSQDPEKIDGVEVYINDQKEPCRSENGTIRFPGANSDGCIFLECYGYVTITLILSLRDGTKQIFSTDYLPVMVRQGPLNDAVSAMTKYVYENQELLQLDGKIRGRYQANLKENGLQNLSALLILAKEIALIYETSYGFFKTNSRTRLEKESVIDRLEHVQAITPATLTYIASHPEQLKPVNSPVGIRVHSRCYQPEKTLAMHQINSYDTYENRVVLSFLRKMVDEVSEMQHRCANLLSKLSAVLPEDEIPQNANLPRSITYVNSGFFIFYQTEHLLVNAQQVLQQLYNTFTHLWRLYSHTLRIPQESMMHKPRPSAIFLAVPQYNKIFVKIHQWFTFGIYDFSKEKYMLSFMNITSLYERYLLIKMADYFHTNGYSLWSGSTFAYPMMEYARYENTTCRNTFLFRKENTRVTLYYQPVIYDNRYRQQNGIGLYRNNSIPSRDQDDTNDSPHHTGMKYYTPDYLLKVEKDGHARYLILDAKFSSPDTVRKHSVRDLAFKYLFSLSTLDQSDTLTGMCLLCGQCAEGNTLQSAYDLSGQDISPSADILPMIEKIIPPENHFRFLGDVFGRLFR